MIDQPAKLLLESGLLGEINRTLLHPLGIAMAVDPENPHYLELQDARDDPEGFDFGPEMLTELRAKLGAFLRDNIPRLRERERRLGFVVEGGSASSLETIVWVQEKP